MRIGFDAKRIVRNGTGLGNYSRYVVDILCRYGNAGDEYLLYAPDKGKPELRRRLADYPAYRYVYPSGMWRAVPALWRTFGLPGALKGRCDVFHGLSNELPVGIRRSGIPSVLTMHDVIYRRYPHLYKPVDRRLYDLKYGHSCRCADRIIAVSECTKRDVVEFYGINPDKIDVVYQGCDPAFYEAPSADALADVRKKYALPERFILNVGTIEERKNLRLAVEALAQMKDRTVCLVAIGRRTDYAREAEAVAERLGVDRRFRILQGVPFADLRCIYRLALLFVYPSRFEGFGIPIIEALASSVPVIAATGSCLEEAGGKDSLYVDSDDAGQLAEYADAVLSDESRARGMIDAGREYVKRFADSRLAADLEAVYRKLV